MVRVTKKKAKEMVIGVREEGSTTIDVEAGLSEQPCETQ
jgi:hypothetical protein